MTPKPGAGGSPTSTGSFSQAIKQKSSPPEGQSLRARLEIAQEKHLRFLENWSQNMPRVCGVDVIKAMSYELIQIVNQRLLEPEQGKEAE